MRKMRSHKSHNPTYFSTYFYRRNSLIINASDYAYAIACDRTIYIYRYYIYLLVYIHIHSYILIAIHNIYILTLSHARAVKRVCQFFLFFED